jgi:hypothetical protein
VSSSKPGDRKVGGLRRFWFPVLQADAELAQLDDCSSTPADRVRREGHLTAYDEEEARALVEEHEDWLRAEERTTAEARARHVRTLVLLDVYERFRVDVVDAEAALWLAVPDELRAP